MRWPAQLALSIGTTLALSGAASAQSMLVYPVVLKLAAQQRTAFLTLVNQGDISSPFQVRVYRWRQGGDAGDELEDTSAVVASPPLGAMAPGAAQIIRFKLRQPAAAGEVAYRVLVDQLPVPTQSGTVRVALRFSVPIFVAPAKPGRALLGFHIERKGDAYTLVARNSGPAHDVLRGIELRDAGGSPLRVNAAGPPYILAGAARRWPVSGASAPPGPWRLHVNAELSGAIDQAVAVTPIP